MEDWQLGGVGEVISEPLLGAAEEGGEDEEGPSAVADTEAGETTLEASEESEALVVTLLLGTGQVDGAADYKLQEVV